MSRLPSAVRRIAATRRSPFLGAFVVAVLAGSALVLSACGSRNGDPGPGGAAVRGLGQPYRTSHGEVFLIRVQDEYKLIRCIPTGPIAGCYQDVFKVARDAITDQSKSDAPYRWNQWIPVTDMPGVQVMFLGPDRIALRETLATR